MDSINLPNGSTVEAHPAPTTGLPAPTLKIPEPESPQPPSSSDAQWESGRITALTKYPSKVTHILLPALLTEWHRMNVDILWQPEYEDLLKEWAIMVQKVDNTSKDYYNII